VRTLVLAIEAAVRLVLLEGDEGRKVTDAQLGRARKVLARIVSGAIAGGGDDVTALPLAPL
jgi:hypothetical protein